MEDFKDVEIKDRKFVVKKFDARTGSFMLIKVTGIIGPMLKGLDMSKIGANSPKPDAEAEDDKVPNIKGIDIAGIASGLSSLSEDDFNYVYNKCLQVCFEVMPAGNRRVMDSGGNFGVVGLENDSAATLALVAHTLIFNVASFFQGSPLASVLGGLLTK